MKAYSRRYAADHPEEVKKANHRNYAKNREEQLEQRRKYNKEYYKKNRDRILAKARERKSGKNE